MKFITRSGSLINSNATHHRAIRLILQKQSYQIMKKRVLYFLTGVVGLISASILLSACSDDPKTARVEVRLTDAPGDYEEVNIDIQGVEIHTNSGDEDTGWKSLDINPGVYNLLDLTNGLDTLLGVIDVPEGRISQIRLVLGNDNSIKVDGSLLDLTTPSAQQSGLKLNVQTNVKAGITYTFLLDFDAARSIVNTGMGDYKLKPVIRVITKAVSGAIKGSVSIPASSPAVYATVGTDTLGTTFADATGHFLIKGLPEGIYTVSFAPATGYTIAAKTGVIVTNNNVTDIGQVDVNN